MRTSISKLTAVFFAFIVLGGCQQEPKSEYIMSIEKFGEIMGQKIELISLTNKAGNTVKLTNYGATIVWIDVPDRDGNKENITFGYENLEGYLNGDPYFGSVVGRYANRIAKGKFTLEGEEYDLAINNEPNTLHGGPGGWHSVVWDAEVMEDDSGIPSIKFSYTSPHMEEGYPGEVKAEVSYRWTDNNEIIIDYRCSSDRATVLNITNHAYFNLHGAGNADILDHELIIKAEKFIPVDETLIPTGELRPVEGTPFDFRTSFVVGERIDDDYDQLILGRGYDHTFVLDNTEPVDAVIYDKKSGRVIEMETDEPGVQLYCGNFLDGTQTGHGDKKYNHRSGLCLETQHFPDSPNQPEFPSVILEPGKEYKSRTLYRFTVK